MDTAVNINQEKLNGSIRYLDKMGDMTVESLREAAPEVSERLERLGELLKDEEFCKQLVTCESKEAAVKLFTDRDFDITEEELRALVTRTRELVNQLIENDGELSEEELERIAGGAGDTFTLGDMGKFITATTTLGTVIGSIAAPGIGTLLGVSFGAALGAMVSGLFLLTTLFVDFEK